MRKIRRIARLIIILPMLALIVASLSYLVRVNREFNRRLPQAISSLLSESVNGTVVIGGVQTYPQGVVFSDFSIRDRHTSGGPIIQMPLLKIECPLIQVVLGDFDLVRSIKQVEMVRPVIRLERAADGRWNFSSILKPKPGKKVAFTAKVFIRSANVTIRDFKPDPARPTLNRLSDAGAVIDFAEQPLVKYSIWGDGDQARLRRLVVDGSYNSVDHALKAALGISGASAPYFSRYPWRIGLNVTAGTADGTVSLYQGASFRHISYSGLIKVSSSSMVFRQVTRPITQVGGLVYLREGRASIRAQGRLGRSPFTVSGDVVDFKHPRLALAITSSHIDFKEAASLTRQAGRLKDVLIPTAGRVRAIVTGPPKSLSVSFVANAPSVAWRNLSGRAVSAAGVYSQNRVVLNAASAGVYGGRVEASGAIDLGGPQANLTGRAIGLHLNAIPELAKWSAAADGATSSGDFEVFLKSNTSSVRYRGTVSSFAYQRVRFEGTRADVSLANGRIKINEISTRAFGGLIAVSGDVAPNGALDLSASGASINLAKVRDMYWKPVTVGRAEFKGRVTGTLQSPTFIGEIAADKVAVAGRMAERIAGGVTVRRDLIAMDKLVVHRYPGTVTISGSIRNPWIGSPSVVASLKADSIELGGLTESYGPYMPESAKLSGDMLVSGALRNPAVEADLSITGGAVRGISIDEARLRGRYSDGDVTVREITVRSGDSSLVATGNVNRDGRIAASFESKQLALEEFSGLFEPYVAVSGRAGLSGTVAGTLDDPVGALSFDSRNLLVNGQAVDSLGFKGSFRDGIASVSDAVLSIGNSRYSIRSASYDSNADSLRIDAHVENGYIERILSGVRASPATAADERLRDYLSRLPKPFSGRVNADISGSVKRAGGKALPDLQADVTLAEVKLGDQPVAAITVKGSWKSDVARLEKLEASEGEMKLTADGTYGPHEAIGLNLSGKSLDAGAVRGWLGVEYNFSGKADVELVASGTTHTPSAEMHLEIRDPMIGGAKFDGLKGTLTLGILAAGTPGGQPPPGELVNISDLTLSVGPRVQRISGYIPVNLRTFKMVEDSPMLIQASLDSDSLAILSAFSQVKLDTRSSGSFAGLVKLSGTKRAPVFEGTLSWKDGVAQLPRINSPLQEINAQMSLVGDKITIEQLTGSSAEGGTFAVAGNVSFPGLKPTLDLEVKASRLGLSGRNLTGMYGEDFQAKVDGMAKLSGYWRTPMIAGTLDIPEGAIAMPKTPPKNASAILPPGLDPRFDLKVVLGRNVRFGAARLKTPLAGQVDVAGSLSKPQVNGKLDVSGGTLLLPLNRFKLMPGSTITLGVSPGSPPKVEADLQAQTRVTYASVLQRPRLYTINMTAHGMLDDLNMQFTSSPPGLPQEVIVGLLAGRTELESLFAKNGPGVLGPDIPGLVSAMLLPSVFEPVEETFESKLGFEEFSLGAGYQQPLMLTVGQHLVDSLYLDYSAILGARPDYSDAAYQLRLSYRLRPTIEVGVQTDQNQGLALTVEGTSRF